MSYEQFCQLHDLIECSIKKMLVQTTVSFSLEYLLLPPRSDEGFLFSLLIAFSCTLENANINFGEISSLPEVNKNTNISSFILHNYYIILDNNENNGNKKLLYALNNVLYEIKIE